MTIQGRLSFWYSLVVLVVLAVAGASVLALQARLGLARVDAELAAASASAGSALATELREGQGLADAARDLVGELELSGAGFAIVSAEGVVLGASPIDGLRPGDSAILAAADAATSAGARSTRLRIRSASAPATAGGFRVVTWKPLGPLDAERGTLGRALLLGTPVTVFLSILGGVTIGRRALRPLASMAAQASAIRPSELEARLSVPNPSDELGVVAQAFNGVLERLARSLRQQRSFMADASHQLRTPVSVMRTTAQVTLSRGDRSQEEYREALAVIERQAERLTKLVNDMFMLAMVDAEARPLQPAPFYFDEMADDIVSDLRVLAVAKHVALELSATAETPYVGDESLLRQMLANLLENAIRHAPAHGAVTVALDRSAEVIALSVADTGAGIAAGDVERVFDRFVRLDSSGADAGGGLGLPIARWIAEAHGGSLVLTSTSAAGSEFLVTLPVAPVGSADLA